eukprot:snap_masked-scaffold_10-processed-gene-11.40-mRNA-1 protein AED:0.02 eAED:0.02 QI:0/0/0/1/1/1/2/0/144
MKDKERSSADPNCVEPACKSKLDMFKSMQSAYNKKQQKEECPASTEELGRATWTFLHSTAAYFPDKPTRDEQQLAQELMKSVAKFYPCNFCRNRFQKDVEEHPINTSSRESFSKDLCYHHNIVNKMLGKKVFEYKRWRKNEDCE